MDIWGWIALAIFAAGGYGVGRTQGYERGKKDQHWAVHRAVMSALERNDAMGTDLENSISNALHHARREF